MTKLKSYQSKIMFIRWDWVNGRLTIVVTPNEQYIRNCACAFESLAKLWAQMLNKILACYSNFCPPMTWLEGEQWTMNVVLKTLHCRSGVNGDLVTSQLHFKGIRLFDELLCALQFHLQVFQCNGHFLQCPYNGFLIVLTLGEYRVVHWTQYLHHKINYA